MTYLAGVGCVRSCITIVPGTSSMVRPNNPFWVSPSTRCLPRAPPAVRQALVLPSTNHPPIVVTCEYTLIYTLAPAKCNRRATVTVPTLADFARRRDGITPFPCTLVSASLYRIAVSIWDMKIKSPFDLFFEGQHFGVRFRVVGHTAVSASL